MKENRIPIEVSARHIHLSQSELKKLFGEDYELNILKELSQPGQFAAKETISIVGTKGKLENVRVIGPCRKHSQVEVSKTDGYVLGVIPPVRISGNIKDSPGIKLIGPRGEVNLSQGLICAQRHLHMSLEDMNKYSVQNKQVVSVEVFGDRALIYKNVIVRVDQNFKLSFQIDTDEANAGNVKNGDFGRLIV